MLLVGFGASSFNKLALYAPGRDLEAGGGGVRRSARSVRPRRCGGGRRGDLVQSAAPQGFLEAATSGVQQRRRSCVVVILGRRGRSVLWCCGRHKIFNLQAGEPTRRPFSGSAAASCVAPSPSGAVPGDGADGHSVELTFLGGEGRDCFFKVLYEVLSVKVEDCVELLFIFQVLFVIYPIE
jgi:hypothetical protein